MYISGPVKHSGFQQVCIATVLCISSPEIHKYTLVFQQVYIVALYIWSPAIHSASVQHCLYSVQSSNTLWFWASVYGCCVYCVYFRSSNTPWFWARRMAPPIFTTLTPASLVFTTFPYTALIALLWQPLMRYWRCKRYPNFLDQTCPGSFWCNFGSRFPVPLR